MSVENGSKAKSIKVLKAGSLVRVILPAFEGKFALGVVSHFQVIYYSDEVYVMVHVEMLIEGLVRPFELENLEVMPRIANGWDAGLVAEVLRAEAA